MEDTTIRACREDKVDKIVIGSTIMNDNNEYQSFSKFLEVTPNKNIISLKRKRLISV